MLIIEIYSQFIMGTQSSKIKDILFVTGAFLDPPQPTPADRPYKEVSVDYSGFKKRKYYKEDASDKEVEEHIEKLNEKQGILKQFRHYKDFDRIDYKRQGLMKAIFQVYVEESIKIAVLSGLLMARFTAVQYFSNYFTWAKVLKMWVPFCGIMIPAMLFNWLTCPEYHIVNHEFFRTMPLQQALYVELDQQLNLYKDVEDMKYNYKYSSLSDFYKTRRHVLDTTQFSMKASDKECYLYDRGLLLDPFEEFVKERQSKRTGNWEILSEQQRKIIQKEIGSRKA